MTTDHYSTTVAELEVSAEVYELDGQRVSVIDGKAVCTCSGYKVNRLLYGVPECRHTEAVMKGAAQTTA